MTPLREILFVFLLWPMIVLAQGTVTAGQATPPREWNSIEGEKLEALKLKGDPERGAEAFEVCQGCHRRGATGSPSGAYPRLAGQHRTVLIEQMTDIRGGVRQNPKMAPFSSAHILTVQEVADIAAYLSALPIPPNMGRGPGTALARGKELYVKDCASCHGSRGEGNADKFYPLVAGQNYEYVVRQTRAIRDGQRGNANPDMVRAVKGYDDRDIAAVSDYICGLEAPRSGQ